MWVLVCSSAAEKIKFYTVQCMWEGKKLRGKNGLIYRRIWRANNVSNVMFHSTSTVNVWIICNLGDFCVVIGLLAGYFWLDIAGESCRGLLKWWNLLSKENFFFFCFRMQIRTSLNYWRRKAGWFTAVVTNTAIHSAGGKERSTYGFKTECCNWGTSWGLPPFPSSLNFLGLTSLKVKGIKRTELEQLQFWFSPSRVTSF